MTDYKNQPQTDNNDQKEIPPTEAEVKQGDSKQTEDPNQSIQNNRNKFIALFN